MKLKPDETFAAGKPVDDCETVGAEPNDVAFPKAGAAVADWPKVGRAEEKLNEEEEVTAGVAAASDGDEPKLGASDEPKAGAAFDSPKVGAVDAGAATGCELPNSG